MKTKDAILKQFKETALFNGFPLPDYCAKDKGLSYVRGLMWILDGLTHEAYFDFLEFCDIPNTNDMELRKLYEITLHLLLTCLDIKESPVGSFKLNNVNRVKKYCGKVTPQLTKRQKEVGKDSPDYLSLRLKKSDNTALKEAFKEAKPIKKKETVIKKDGKKAKETFKNSKRKRAQGFYRA